MDCDRFLVKPGTKVSLRKHHDPGDTGQYRKKTEAAGQLEAGVQELARLQDILYAQNEYAVLVIFQAMDAAGKDSTIKHVMSGVNPQGCQVFSFKTPSSEELDHGYLWRAYKALPERGRIGIFNRSYYEDVLVVRVHPDILAAQQLPKAIHDQNSKGKGQSIWEQRFEQINNFENYLVDNGIIVLKFFLNVSKAEQKERFLDRINRPEKNWKFSPSDVQERAFWDDYQQAYEAVFRNTSTAWAPWYIIPADHKWFTRLTVAEIIGKRLQALNLSYPTLSETEQQQLQAAKEMLEREQD